MKLKLAVEKGIALLDVLEDVLPAHIDVLRAGLNRLLGEGRNRIVLDLSLARKLNVALLGDIMAFNNLARELGGEVVIVGQGELMREATAQLGMQPGAVGIPRNFPTKQAAAAALEAQAAPPDPLFGDPIAELRLRLEKLQHENASLKSRSAMLSGLDELRRLRRENGALRRDLGLLEERLASIAAEQKPGLAAPHVEERVKTLETALAGFVEGVPDGR